MNRRQTVLPSDGNAAQRSFGDIVIDLQAPVVDIAAQYRPLLRAIGDSLGDVGFWRQPAQCSVECLTWRIDQRLRPVLPRLQPHVRRFAADPGFYAVQGKAPMRSRMSVVSGVATHSFQADELADIVGDHYAHLLQFNGN